MVLMNLKTEYEKDERPLGGDPRECFQAGFHRINLTRGISSPPVIEGTRFFEKRHDNWAVIDIANLLNPQEEPEAKTVEDMGRKGKTVTERMKVLKELYDNDLITKDEYKKKKAEILDEL